MKHALAALLLFGCGGIHPEISETPPEATEQNVTQVPETAAAPERLIWTLAATYENSSKIKNLKNECSDATIRIVKQAAIKDVTSCFVRHFQSGDRSLYFVKLEYGKVSDCPSGCVQKHVTGIVSDDDVRAAAFPEVSASQFYYRTALGDVLPSLGVQSPGSYSWYDSKKGTACGAKQQPTLVSLGKEIWWEFDLNHKPHCIARPRIMKGKKVQPLGVEVEISGRITIPIDFGEQQQIDPYAETKVDVIRKPQ